MLALIACNEILDNREGVLRRDVGTTEAAPTQPAKGGDASATEPPDSSSDASRPGDVDAATEGARTDAASACPPGLEATSKSCGTRCVSLDDPNYGCAAETCSPCNIPNATPTCMKRACAIFACVPGTADCNGSPVDGCETDLTSPLSCGSCSNMCPTPPHAVASCAGGCTFECDVGWADCNGNPIDGCETNLMNDPASCGQCGRGCLFGGCAMGLCVLL